MPLFLPSKYTLNEIEWSRSWLWDIQFQDANLLHFRKWFPATNVSINRFALETYDFTAGLSTFSVPKSSTLFDMKITFVDDVALTVQTWVSNWINNEIFAQNAVATLEEAVKQVTVVTLDNNRKQIKQDNFMVFPKGSLYFDGNSDEALHSAELDLVIAATLS